ncbi:MAG: PepSY-like domain-containing protein [Weeksellaceae bacterium]
MRLVFFKTILAVLAIGLMTACNNDDDNSNSGTPIDYGDLPAASRAMLETNFPDATLVSATKLDQPEANGTLYKTFLSNQYEVDFDADGGWTGVFGNGNPVPDDLVLQTILDYVAQNYPSPIYIEEIEREDGGWEVELSNDIDLYFDAEGNFISADFDGDGENDEVAIPYSDLPASIRAWIENHFPGAQATLVKMKSQPDDDGTVYEANLNNGFELEFDADGNWTEIDGDDHKVPDGLIPPAILSYVHSNYPENVFIQSIERKSYGYKIELSVDLDLKFDSDGNFIGFDD